MSEPTKKIVHAFMNVVKAPRIGEDHFRCGRPFTAQEGESYLRLMPGSLMTNQVKDSALRYVGSGDLCCECFDLTPKYKAKTEKFRGKKFRTLHKMELNGTIRCGEKLTKGHGEGHGCAHDLTDAKSYVTSGTPNGPYKVCEKCWEEKQLTQLHRVYGRSSWPEKYCCDLKYNPHLPATGFDCDMRAAVRRAATEHCELCPGCFEELMLSKETKEVAGRATCKEPNQQTLPKQAPFHKTTEPVCVPSEPDVLCCAFCNEPLRPMWTLKTGLKLGCYEHGIDVSSVRVGKLHFQVSRMTDGDRKAVYEAKSKQEKIDLAVNSVVEHINKGVGPNRATEEDYKKAQEEHILKTWSNRTKEERVRFLASRGIYENDKVIP